MAVFCLGGDNPITTAQNKLDVVPINAENNAENDTTTSGNTNTTSQATEGTVLWKRTIAKIANPELNPALGDVYTKTVWVYVDAFTGEVTQIYYSR